ncbi:MAG: hypothetical protein ONB17_09575 [candidate division KSB1 bacterium]|nr:hypothetical protein [candidate division KSB1 bacterium]MDZ7295400.1 hypothetical protein [candidate division KSB1 bacterium]
MGLRCLFLFLLGVTGYSLQAQEKDALTGLFQRSQQACEQGRYLEGAKLLRQALSELNKVIVAGVEQLLPEPERGWEAQMTNADADEDMLITGLRVWRQYAKSNSAQMVEVEITIGSLAAGDLMVWLTNPREMERASEGSKLVTIDGRRWVRKFVERDQTAELATVVGGDRVVRVRGYNLRSAEPAERYAARVPLQKLERLFH